MRYRVALQGFTSFERHALLFCFHEAEEREPGYEFVETLVDADLIVADGDSEDVADSIRRHGLMGITAFVGLIPPPGAAAHVPRPIDPARILESLGDLAARKMVAPATTANPAIDAGRAPGNRRAAEPGAVAARDAESAAKSKARKAARRARLVSAAGAMDSAAAPPNVLVLDDDDPSREQLCSLLEAFGFCTYPVKSVAQANWMAQTQAFAAAFIYINFDSVDADDAVDLCHRIRQAPPPAEGQPCALIVLCSNAHPADRVRAALVGAGAVLAKPVARGPVARALETCGITLPADARHI